MKCQNCGAEVSGGVCQYCGSKVDEKHQTVIINNYYESSQPAQYTNYYSPAVSSKDKIVALVLCILFGYFGVHYFYAGRIGMGILYLFTAGLFGIGWIVDIFRIAVGAFRDGYGLMIK